MKRDEARKHERIQKANTLLIAGAKPKRYRGVGSISLPDAVADLAHQAARERGISMAAYCRRAVTAFIARDLGMDFFKLMKNEQASGYASRVPEYVDGQGAGEWRITGLK